MTKPGHAVPYTGAPVSEQKAISDIRAVIAGMIEESEKRVMSRVERLESATGHIYSSNPVEATTEEVSVQTTQQGNTNTAPIVTEEWGPGAIFRRNGVQSDKLVVNRTGDGVVFADYTDDEGILHTDKAFYLTQISLITPAPKK